MATISIAMQRDLSSSSNCSSERIAPYACSRLYHEDTLSASAAPRSQLLSQAKAVLDDAAKSRLIQLYTTRKPVSSPKRIQAHFTCLYLTGSNINEILNSRSGLSTSSRYHSLRHSRAASTCPSSQFHDLSKLIQQSWRVSYGTLDFLELIWTGHRSTKGWADLLNTRSDLDCDTSTTDHAPPQNLDEDDYLALNLAVTYYYTPEGQPTLSLAAIAMTQDAFNAIKLHTSTSTIMPPTPNVHPYSETTSPPNSATSFPNLTIPSSEQQIPSFDKIPFVHRDILVPTLCRWRNADVQSTLAMAAEGRAWSSKLLSEDHHHHDFNTPGAWFFPTIKPTSEPTSPTSSSDYDSDFDDDDITNEQFNTATSAGTSPVLLLDDSPPTHPAAAAAAYPAHTHQLPPVYELRAALAPGRDAAFRTVATRLSGVLRREWIRRSSQLPLDSEDGRAGGPKRRRGA